MKRFLFWLSLFSLALTGSAPAQTNASKTITTAKPIAPLVSYILQNGSPQNAEAYLLQPLHLSDQDLPVIQKGWKSRNDGMSHLVAVSKNKNSDVLLFLFNKTGVGVCWLTSPSGELRCAVKFTRATHTAEIVPNEKLAKSFELEKAYLLNRAATAPKSAP